MNNFYNPYMIQGNYLNELQNMRDNLDKKIQQVQQQNFQQPSIQQPSINQTFQLSSNVNEKVKYVNSIEDVEKDIVLTDTYFFNNNMSNLWIKNSKGDIRSFNIEEIVPKDEKDIIIENLQKQIEELKNGGINEHDEQNVKQLCKSTSAELEKQTRNSIATTIPSNVSNLSNNKTTKRKS